jgi:hypothetical protein
MKKAIWLSYDLGVQGDYEGLYQWLDKRGAIECGDSLAFFKLEVDDRPIPDPKEEIKRELQEAIKVDSRTRVYMIWRQGNSVKGNFIFGQRKAPPWSGYSPKQSTEDAA